MGTNKEKKNWKVYIPLTAVVILVIILGSYWYIDYSSYLKTDDAYIASDNISVSPKILGRIIHLYAEEGDSVTKGELLVELDTTDMLAQRQQFRAAKEQTEAAKLQAEAKYSYDQKNIRVLEIGLEKANDDFSRAQAQYNGGVITKEQFDHIKKAVELTQAQTDAAKAQIDVSKTQIKSAETAIATAQAQIDLINTQMGNAKLYAPVGGVVAKRWLLTGDVSQPGQSIYTINNKSKRWILIYLEETKVGKVFIGQKSKFTIDAFPDVTFVGEVFAIGSNTASQFSLIPPSNASGNFTKVTQRIPVKISIDGTEGGQKLSSFNLLSGMSAVVKIHKK
jgi:membrane fusion protein, multidrug efflux system